MRSPGRQGPGTANRQCTNSVGCVHAPVPSTIPRDPAAPSTGRLGPGNGHRPLVRTADLASPSSPPYTPVHTPGPHWSPCMRPPALLLRPPPPAPAPARDPVPPPSNPKLHPRPTGGEAIGTTAPQPKGLRRRRRGQVCARRSGAKGVRGRPDRGEETGAHREGKGLSDGRVVPPLLPCSVQRAPMRPTVPPVALPPRPLPAASPARYPPPPSLCPCPSRRLAAPVRRASRAPHRRLAA